MVSFTGKYDATFLEKVDGSTQTVTQEPHQEFTRLAHRARDRLRYAEMLKRRRTKGSNTFTDDQRALLEELDLGTLRTEANDATHKSGWLAVCSFMAET